MRMLRTRYGSIAVWVLLALSFAAWGSVAYAYLYLQDKRIEYADRAVVSSQESERHESLARLRALVQGTEVERAAIEGVMNVRIVDAAEMVEKAVSDAGAKEVEISEASASAPNKEGISSVLIGVNASGSFVTVMRAVLLLETLPLPSTIEQFEVAENKDEWRLTARLRLTLSSVQ